MAKKRRHKPYSFASKRKAKKEDKTWIWMCALIGLFFIFTIVTLSSRVLKSNSYHKAISTLKEIVFSEKDYPPTLKSLIVHPNSSTNYFDFVLDSGESTFETEAQLKPQAKELIDYFFLGITLPSEDLWVNLNSVRQNEITSPRLALTDIGKVLLEADLRLKKDCCRFTDPRTKTGREYWNKLQQRLNEGGLSSSKLPIGNRFWIIPAEAAVEEDEEKTTIVKSKLRVCLEQEYLALQGNNISLLTSQNERERKAQDIADFTMKEVVLPAIQHEVTYGKGYAKLRQVYNSLILAEYFKQKYWGGEGLYPRLVNRGYIQGLESNEPWSSEDFYNAYLKSTQEGEYRLTQTEYDPYLASMVQKYYFYGGITFVYNLGQILKIGQADSEAAFTAQTTLEDEPTSNGEYLVEVATQAQGNPYQVGLRFARLTPETPIMLTKAKFDEEPEPEVSFNSSGAIGRFIEIEPVRVDEQGRLQGKVQNIDTKEKVDLSTTAQRKLDFSSKDDAEEMQRYISNLERLIWFTYPMTQPQRLLLEYTLEQFKSNFPKHVIITREAKAGFFGVGKPDLLVINSSLLNNPVSFLHEIVEYLKHTNPEIIYAMEASLFDYQKLWIGIHEEKYTTQGKHEYFLENKAHYIIRAFTRQAFGEADRELTMDIKRIIATEEAIRKKSQIKISLEHTYEKTTPALPEDTEFAKKYRGFPDNKSRIEFLLEHYPMPGVKIEVESIPPSPFVPKGTGRAEAVGPKHFKITLIGVEGSYEQYLLFHEFMHFWLGENGFMFDWDTDNAAVANYLFRLRNLVNDYLIEKENRKRFGSYYTGITKDLRDFDLQNQFLFMAGKKEADNIGNFMLALTCKTVASLYPELSDSLSAKVVGNVFKGGALVEVITEVTRISIGNSIEEYKETIRKIHRLLTEDEAKFRNGIILVNTVLVSEFIDKIDELMAQIAELRKMRRQPGPDTTDAIGKFVEIDPVKLDRQGRLQGKVQNIDTKEALDLSELDQRKASSEEIKYYIRNLEQLIQDTTMANSQRLVLNRILRLFRSSLPQNIIITQEVKAGFYGIGKPNLIVINQELVNNPISFLHEITEYLKHTHPEIIRQLEDLLDSSGQVWLTQHEEKYMKEGKYSYFLQNRDHYVIRAFTRQVFAEKDKALTDEIKHPGGIDFRRIIPK